MNDSSWQDVGAGMGFAGAGAQLGAMREDNDQLRAQVDAGQLTMNPESAEKAAKVYEDKADKIAVLITRAEQLDRVEGLGEYRSGQELASKFQLKAKNGQTGAADLLAQLRDELNRKAELFRDAAKDYVARDERIAGDLGKGMEQ